MKKIDFLSPECSLLSKDWNYHIKKYLEENNDSIMQKHFKDHQEIWPKILEQLDGVKNLPELYYVGYPMNSIYYEDGSKDIVSIKARVANTIEEIVEYIKKFDSNYYFFVYYVSKINGIDQTSFKQKETYKIRYNTLEKK